MRHLSLLFLLASCTLITRNIAPPACESESTRCDGADLVLCLSEQEVRVDCGAPESCDAVHQICAICGDATQSPNEACDDGAANSDTTADACRTDCQIARCGDSVTDTGEGCDDGNAAAGDGCSSCVSESCGDGIVQAANEQCDDGNLNDNDGCSSVCRDEFCGDNIPQNNEQCDDGVNNSDTTPDACRTDCKDPTCGDNVTDSNEQCDDGNLLLEDGCDDLCLNEFCGDGIVQTGLGEECDDRGTQNEDGCDAACKIEFCGDDILQTGLGEECDDGINNANAANACRTTCALPACGDNIADNGEQCDDGNGAGGDGCNAACQTEFCGDNIVQPALGEECDDGNAISGDGCDTACQNEFCGDNIVQAGLGELCDDGNTADNDGCDADCIDSSVVAIEAGDGHTCAKLRTGDIRCFGLGNTLALGYGSTADIGDNETPASAGDVSIGAADLQISAGDSHSCAVLAGGNLRCWGSSSTFQLGYGNSNNVGVPTSVGFVNVGGAVQQVSASGTYTCALLTNGNVRCWGIGFFGQLGYGNSNTIGDNELPLDAGNVNVGVTVSQIATGGLHTCALSTTGNVRCWGFASSGQLGYSNTINIGDNETPASAGDVNIGGAAQQISLGGLFSCALLNNGNVRCWGNNGFGQLGYGNTINIGDNETPASAGNVLLGAIATQISAGSEHVCALLDAGDIICWGRNDAGQLGYGNLNDIGDNETPQSIGPISIGGSTDVVLQVTAGGSHTCALLDTGKIRCWGNNANGRLGYGNTTNQPSATTVPDVTLF